jgi:membrane protein
MQTPSFLQPLWWRLPLRLRHALQFVANASLRWAHDGGPQLGAAIAFYTMFALAPLLVIAIAIAGAVFGADAARGHIVMEIQALVGETAARGIEAMIESAWRSPNSGLAGTLGLVTLFVGASGVFAELRKALNMIGHVTPLPSMLGAFVRARLMAFALVLGVGFLAIASLVLSALLTGVMGYLSKQMPILSSALAVMDLALSTAVLTVAFAGLLRWLPDRPPSRHALWVGALASAALFAVGKHLIGLYISRASVASSYGAAGSFVVIMLWVYYSAQILLFGAAIAATLDNRPGGTPVGPSPDPEDSAAPAAPQGKPGMQTPFSAKVVPISGRLALSCPGTLLAGRRHADPARQRSHHAPHPHRRPHALFGTRGHRQLNHEVHP